MAFFMMDNVVRLSALRFDAWIRRQTKKATEKALDEAHRWIEESMRQRTCRNLPWNLPLGPGQGYEHRPTWYPPVPEPIPPASEQLPDIVTDPEPRPRRERRPRRAKREVIPHPGKRKLLDP